MALDPNIILQGQAPQVNPLQMASQVAGLKNMLLQNQSGQIANQAAQQDLASRQALGQVVARHTSAAGVINYPGAIADASSDPDAARGLAQFDQQALSNQTAQTDLDQKNLTLAKDHVSTVMGMLGPLLSNKKLQQSDVIGVLADGVSQGLITPQSAIQESQGLPTDSAGLNQWAQAHFMRYKSLSDQIAARGQIQTTNLGNRTAINQVNPFTGDVSNLATAQNGLSPSDQIAQQKTTLQNGGEESISNLELAGGKQPQGGFQAPSLAATQPTGQQTGQGGAVASQQLPQHLVTKLSSQQQASNDASAQAYTEAQNKSASYRSMRGPLYAEIDNIVKQGVGTGPQANVVNYVGRTISQLFGQKDTAITQATANSDLLTKDLSQIQQQNVGSQGGVATGDKISSATAATPHPEMSTQGMLIAKAALQGTDQANDMAVKAYDHYAANNPNPMPFNQYAIQFNSEVDPLTFILRSMPKANMTHYLDAMTPQQRAKITQSSNTLDTLAKGIGWQP